MDKMVYEQNSIGQNGTDKMVYGQNKHSINPAPTDNMIFSSIPLPL